jgi:nitroreductase
MIHSLPQPIQDILTAGNQAPSGENCQPWHFVVKKNTIEIHLLEERDHSVYSWGQRASFFANGAVIENMVIAARVRGYTAGVVYFPDQGDEWHVATLTLSEVRDKVQDPLGEAIMHRVSNRKAYEETPITSTEKEALFKAAGEGEYGSLILVTDKEKLSTLGRVGSTNEEVMLSNRFLHQFFFNHINWTLQEDTIKKVGFFIRTLELPFPAQLAFRAIRHWPIQRVLNRIGFHTLVATQNAATNATAGGIGILVIPGLSPLDFVRAGRTLERVWLTATHLGLSFQPLAGIPFLRLRVLFGDTEVFSAKNEESIIEAYQRAALLADVRDKHIAFMFRVGRSSPPSARAVRFPLQEVVTINS